MYERVKEHMKAKNREQETEHMPLYYLHDDRKKKRRRTELHI